MTYPEYAYICKTLGDPTRIKIFDMLKEGKQCACEILEKFDITQPTLSYHMKMLTQSGLITAQKEGKWIYYSINQEVLKEFIDFLTSAKTE
ncbi:MAG TPA: metalloregulator ArsR/SmtB family transcription factor [Clostridia bacterium]